MQRWTRFALLAAAAAVITGCATVQRPAAPKASRAPVPRQGAGHQPPSAPAIPVAQARIALLVPVTGPLAAAGASVRDGFLTSYYQTAMGQRPTVRVYYPAGTPAPELIAPAVHLGPGLIVGPLTRQAVAAAATDQGPRPPVLALNFLPAGSHAPSRFFQFALSPTAEARMVASRVLADGYREGIAIVPQGEWGTRVLNAFTQQLQAGGGELLASVRVDPSQTDYSGPVEQVLLVNQSRARHRRLESLLGVPLAFTLRRRGDFQFIFAPAPPAVERLLLPQLRFYYAGGVPDYSTSDAFVPDPVANRDLDGLQFPGTPWMLDRPLAEAVRAAVAKAWPAGGPARGRLFAFGFDADQLAMSLLRTGQPDKLDLNGLSGRLTFAPDGRIRRQLTWARLENGEVQILPKK